MVFHSAKLRVKELANALGVDSNEIIASCAHLQIAASSPLSILSINECKEIIDYIKKE